MEGREFDLTDADFVRIRALARARAGIELGEAKRSMVYGRLVRRLRRLGLDGFRDYLDEVERPGSDEAAAFINALTTNVTDFFREGHHFDFFQAKVLPTLRRGARRRLRFWCAGCSTGEEPYSLAMTMREVFGDAPGWDIRILATDIDSEVLAEGQAGIYKADRLGRVPPALLSRYWERSDRDRYVASPALRSLITFKQLNLLEMWPMQGPFEAIMCRNVIIYFDAATKLGLVRRFQTMLREGGHLFLGHSESMIGGEVGLVSCGRTIYRRGAAKQEAA